MKVVVTDIYGNEQELEQIEELSFLQELDAPCDSLSVSFKTPRELNELVGAMAYDNDTLVFNGLVDKQTTSFNKNGYVNYIYCRSTACVLVDNQAEPFTYNMPSVNQLFSINASGLGFKNQLENIYSNDKYEVSIGTSCFGAINNFISLSTGGRAYVTPDNVMMEYKMSDDICSLEQYKIKSMTKIINRSEPISQINFKKQQASEYSVHCYSSLAKGLGISRERYVNLSSLPSWQRDNTISKRITDSFDSFRLLNIELEGYAALPIYQRCSYGDMNNLIVISRRYCFDKNGSRTILKLKENNEIGESLYVD